jgi:hypothetical protein
MLRTLTGTLPHGRTENPGGLLHPPPRLTIEGGSEGLGMLPTACHPADRPAPPLKEEIPSSAPPGRAISAAAVPNGCLPKQRRQP